MISDEAIQIIRLVIFLGFYAFAAVSIFYEHDNERIKQIFIIFLIIGLVGPTLTGFMAPPFARFYFFTQPAPQNTTQYTVSVVDEMGNEAGYPKGAAPPGQVERRGQLMVTTYNESLRKDTAIYLLEHARAHRQSVSDGLSPIELIQLGIDERLINRNVWTVNEARKLGEINGLRIYRTTINTSEDGLEVTDRQRVLVYQYPSNVSKTAKND